MRKHACDPSARSTRASCVTKGDTFLKRKGRGGSTSQKSLGQQKGIIGWDAWVWNLKAWHWGSFELAPGIGKA